jgi:hypothetical protein
MQKKGRAYSQQIGLAGEYAAASELLFRNITTEVLKIDFGVDLVCWTRTGAKQLQVKTRQKVALKLPLGFWKSKVVKLTERKISKLLEADTKRNRRTYDSFSLFQERRSQSSEPFKMDSILFDPEFEYPRKSHERFELLKINRMMAEEESLNLHR